MLSAERLLEATTCAAMDFSDDRESPEVSLVAGRISDDRNPAELNSVGARADVEGVADVKAEVKGVEEEEEGWVSPADDDAMLTGDIMDAGVVCVSKPVLLPVETKVGSVTMEGSPPTEPADIHTGRRLLPLLLPSDGRDGRSGSWGSEGRPCSAPELVELPTGIAWIEDDDGSVVLFDTVTASPCVVLPGAALEDVWSGQPLTTCCWL